MEDNGGNDNDNDTLGSVQDRGGDGTDSSGEGKGEFVVNVEEESRQGNVHDKRLSSVSFDGLGPFNIEGRKFLDDNEWNGAAERDDVHDSVNVGRVHVLFLVTLKSLGNTRSKLSLERSGDVGHGSVGESGNVDIDSLSFLDASKTDSTNNWDKHGISQSRLDVNRRDKQTNDGGEGRFAGLDNLSERNGTDGGSKDGSSMSEAGAGSDRDAGGNISSGKVGLLAQSSSPHDKTPNNSDDQLGAGDKPMGMDHVGCLFVVYIVEGVTSIPSCDKHGL